MDRRVSQWRVFRAAQAMAVAGLLAGAILVLLPECGKGESPMADHGRTETATLGGGCFWCLEAVFEGVPGVRAVTSGYAGGSAANPTYKQVCEGQTGHAEVVQIEFDPARVTYEQILDLFWQAHDPTTLNRQGADVGSQYRSVIFYNSGSQRMAAEKSVAALSSNGSFSSPIVTEIRPLKGFYRAEEYHQNYFRSNPNAPYCTFVIAPKLKKLQAR